MLASLRVGAPDNDAAEPGRDGLDFVARRRGERSRERIRDRGGAVMHDDSSPV